MSASSTMNTILIIGGTSGIGAAFARRFHSMGKQLIITGRRESKLAELRASLPGTATHVFDITDLASIPTQLDALFAEHPSIDAVWMNAGMMTPPSNVTKPTSSSDAAVVDEITTNITAPLLVARHAIPHLLARGRAAPATFLTTGSGLGFVPVGAAFAVYCATKAAIHQYSVAVRQATSDSNVAVIEIVPPLVDGTDLNREWDSVPEGPAPLPMAEFVDECFKQLDGTPAKDLKEVTAGTGVPRVKAWRDGIGAILAQGLGG